MPVSAVFFASVALTTGLLGAAMAHTADAVPNEMPQNWESVITVETGTGQVLDQTKNVVWDSVIIMEVQTGTVLEEYSRTRPNSQILEPVPVSTSSLREQLGWN